MKESFFVIAFLVSISMYLVYKILNRRHSRKIIRKHKQKKRAEIVNIKTFELNDLVSVPEGRFFRCIYKEQVFYAGTASLVTSVPEFDREALIVFVPVRRHDPHVLFLHGSMNRLYGAGYGERRLKQVPNAAGWYSRAGNSNDVETWKKFLESYQGDVSILAFEMHNEGVIFVSKLSPSITEKVFSMAARIAF